jgi:hypothetical protein
MNRFRSPRLAFLVVLAGVGLLPGCGKKTPPLAPVSGKVTVAGQPLTSGQVSLILDVGNPAQEKEKKTEGEFATMTGSPSTGQIGSDGTYKIFTSGKEGAPLGKYKVTVTPSMMPSSDPKKPPPVGFNRSYGDPKNTPLKFEVVASPAAGTYDLKLNK